MKATDLHPRARSRRRDASEARRGFLRCSIAALLAVLALSFSAFAADSLLAEEPDAAAAPDGAYPEPVQAEEDGVVLPREMIPEPRNPDEAEAWDAALLSDLQPQAEPVGRAIGKVTVPEPVTPPEDFEAIVYAALKNREKVIDVSACGLLMENFESRTNNYYLRVVELHPDLTEASLFYSAVICNADGSVRNIYPKYVSEEKALEEREHLLQEREEERLYADAINTAVAQVEEGMTDLEKALVLHDYLVIHCQYDWETATRGTPSSGNVYSAYGALVNGNAVCEGYARAYRLLLQMAGLEAELISSRQLNHAWNAVKIDGEWYYVDATWDDPVPDLPGRCRHGNFLVSEDGLRETGHTGEDWTPAVTCDSKKFESGYAFNDCDAPLLWRDGTFYYRDETALYQGTLDMAEQRCVTKFGDFYTPVRNTLWVNGCMYYLRTLPRELWCVSILGYGQKLLGGVEFSPAPSEDGCYSAGADGIGLRCRNGKIQAVSVTRPNLVLAEFDPLSMDYPLEWEEGDRGLQGLTTGNASAVILWDRDGSAILYAAGYDGDGRMTGVKALEATLRDGVTLVDLEGAPTGGWKLMLTDSAGERPLCAALDPSAA